MKTYKLLVNDGNIYGIGVKHIAEFKKTSIQHEYECNSHEGMTKQEAREEFEKRYHIEEVNYEVIKAIRKYDDEKVKELTGLNLFF